MPTGSNILVGGIARAVLSPKQLLFAGVLVVSAAVVLGTSQFLIGPNTATAGYLTILFLLSVVRAANWRARLASTVWSIAVALLGYAVGGVGMWVTLIALVVVAVVQAFVTFGEPLFLTRSPANLLAFASLSESGAQIWQVLLGSVIGAGLIWVFAVLARAREHGAHPRTPWAERIGYGIATAAGSLVIVAGADLIGFPYPGWALLSFCIILAVSAQERLSRGLARIAGSVAGAALALVIALIPAPVPMLVAVGCLVLCVAYINAGNYVLFVLFLTPAILLTTGSEDSVTLLAAYRVEALLFASVIALLGSLHSRGIVALIGARERHGASTTAEMPPDTPQL